jgi:hypothetical protein
MSTSGFSGNRWLAAVGESTREFTRKDSGEQLREMAGERRPELAGAVGLFRIGQRAIGGEGLIGAADGELVGQHGDADVSENGAEVDQSAQAAECAGRGGADHGGLAGERGKHGFVVAIGA